MYSSTGSSDTLNIYNDTDYTGDVKSCKSTLGELMQYMGAAVTWSSRKQSSVALFTTESKLIAACEAAKEIVWLSHLYEEITTVTLEQPSLHVNNLSALKLIQNSTFHNRTQHVDIRHFFIHEKIEEGKLFIKHIDGTSQQADT